MQAAGSALLTLGSSLSFPGLCFLPPSVGITIAQVCSQRFQINLCPDPLVLRPGRQASEFLLHWPSALRTQVVRLGLVWGLWLEVE